MDEQMDELVRERMTQLLQFGDIILDRKTCRAIFREGMNYVSDLIAGKWNEFLPENAQDGQALSPTPEDIHRAVIEMAKGVITKGYRTEEEAREDKAQVYNVIRSHFARGYIRGQESLTTNAEVLNMEPWFVHGIEVAGQSTDTDTSTAMPSFWTRDSDAREHWNEVFVDRLRPWGGKGNYRPSAPDASGHYPDDPIYLAMTAIEMQRSGICEDDYTIRHFPLPKTIRLPFLGWSPIPPTVYRSWSTKTLLQDTAVNRRLMYERKDLDISRLRELIALKERWAEQDVQYLRRYRRYVVCDPEARERGFVDGRDISYLPAQRPPFVERVRRAIAESVSGVIDTVTVDGDGENDGGSALPSGEEESVYGPEFRHQLRTASLSAPPSQPLVVDQPKSESPPPIPQRSLARPIAASPFGGSTNSGSTNSPVIAQIDELLSELATTQTDAKNQMKHSISAPQLVPGSSSSSSYPKSHTYHISAIPRPLSSARKGEEKPLPLLPVFLIRGGGSPPLSGDESGSDGDDEEEEEEEEEGEQSPYNPDDPSTLSPLSTIKGSQYILRNSLPQRRSSPEAIQAYARAVEDLHGLCRINRYYSNSSTNTDGDNADPGEEGNSSAGVLATKTVRGRLMRVSSGGAAWGARSEITHDAEGSFYSADVGGEENGNKGTIFGRFDAGRHGSGVVADDPGPSAEAQKRWGSLRRGGSQTWGKARKEIANGIKQYFGVGRR